jgi:hypothetical protein
MDRRAFITMAGRSILAAPLAVGAQPTGKVHRIGFLFYGAPGPRQKSMPFGKGCVSSGTWKGRT